MEDELFTDFCSQINVQNIRQYEEKELRAQQERAKRRLEFENQRSKLVNQLEYERSRDTEGIIVLSQLFIKFGVGLMVCLTTSE